MFRLIWKFSLIFLIAPIFVFAATVPAGIPTGGIWFSKEPFYVGDQISVNTLVFNATSDVIRGSLELLDGATILQQKDVAVDPGDSMVISFPVQVTRGTHAYQIRVAGGDFTGQGGLPLTIKTSGDYVAQTVELKRVAVANPAVAVAQQNSSQGAAALNSGTTSTDITPITSKDAQGIADIVEKVIPAKIVEPVVGLAVPVLGATESFRVDQANTNTARIDNTISDIAKQIGVDKVLGTSTGNIKKGTTTSLFARLSAWSIFGRGITTGNFIQTPFGYVKLFVFLLYHAVVSAAWLFYSLIGLILVKIILFIKGLVLPRPG